MAIENMAAAEPGKEASSSEYNKVVGNVRDLDDRLSSVETGTVRFRAIRTTGGTLKVSETQPFAWLDGVEYAQGISLRNNTDIHLSTPGTYLFTASLCLNGAVSNGNRLQIWIALSGDTEARMGIGQHPLPSSYPLAQATAIVLATVPIDISAFVWVNAAAKPSLYTEHNYCSITGVRVGGV
ncbi:MAG TPA: hypothetical protein DEQ00_04090 [Mycobacterium tuberculosis]|nr:hypothetical protein [Mycobacterium tuberculosis]